MPKYFTCPCPEPDCGYTACATSQTEADHLTDQHTQDEHLTPDSDNAAGHHTRMAKWHRRAADIRAQYNAGASLNELGRVYGITGTRVWQILHSHPAAQP